MSIPRNLYYNESQVFSCGLLSDVRCAELKSLIDSSIEPCFDKDGHEIKNAVLANVGGTKFLYLNTGQSYQTEFMRRDVLSSLLTNEEFKLISDHCLSAGAERLEAQRFEKAEKVDKWDGYIYVGDQYYDSVEDFLDQTEKDDTPDYVWCTKPTQIISGLTVDDVVENQICDRGWEDMGINDLNGVAELQAALNKFVQENEEVVSYYPDYTKALILKKGEISS